MSSVIDETIKTFGLQKLATLPMPSLNGRVIKEPSELDAQRIMKFAAQGELHKIPKEHQDWLCYRLMPSLFRYGVYPPPYETHAANESNFV